MRFTWPVALGSGLIAYGLGVWADTSLRMPISIVGRFAELRLSYNSGIAFGIKLPDTIEAGAITVAVILVAFLATRAHSLLQEWGYGLIMGGAVANVVDRLRDGLVTDYIAIGSFPVFNVADSCITVGVVLLLADSIGLFPSNRMA